MVDDEIVITGRYPTNEEFTKLLDLPGDVLGVTSTSVKVKVSKKNSRGCNCKGGCC